jgi:hypothetical protein
LTYSAETLRKTGDVYSQRVEETDTESFVVKVWLEETVEESGQAKWRGHVTHVSSGNRRYVESLSGIAAFIRPYLERWGVKFGIFQRLLLVLNKRLRKSNKSVKKLPLY